MALRAIMAAIRACVLVLVAGVTFPGSANAVTLVLTADPVFPDVNSSFTVTFDDADANGLLSLSEVVSFSGVSCFICTPVFYTTISDVPDIAGFADGGSTSWGFQAPGGSIGIDPTLFTYAIGQVGQTPLPAALPLFAGGLGTLGLLTWRKRSKSTSRPD